MQRINRSGHDERISIWSLVGRSRQAVGFHRRNAHRLAPRGDRLRIRKAMRHAY